jgi:branched-chain amino acid transport system permease protein
LADVPIIQVLVNGLVVGLTYALVATGFTLVLGVAKIVNFAHAEFYMLGGFGAYWFYGRFGLNYWLALIITAILVGFLGIILERFFFRQNRGHFLLSVAGSVGIALILSGTCAVLFGTNAQAVPPVFEGVAILGPLRIAWERVFICGASFLLLLGVHFFIQRTKTGKAMRAVVSNSDVAALLGVNVNLTYMKVMALGSGLAAVAGVLIAPVFSVEPFMGGPILFKALLIMFIGGVGSVPGSMLAGFLLGLIESIGFTFLGGLIQVVGFILVGIFVVFRPGGLFGSPFKV